MKGEERADERERKGGGGEISSFNRAKLESVGQNQKFLMTVTWTQVALVASGHEG